MLLFAACLTLFTRYRRAKPVRARVEEQHSCVQPKPTRSTPIAKDVDAAFDRAINAINADKLKRYALFDTVSRGGTQRADGWYQDNVEPAVTRVREERVGPAGEGGKWLCDPNRLRARGADCLIYSVGVSMTLVSKKRSRGTCRARAKYTCSITQCRTRETNRAVSTFIHGD